MISIQPINNIWVNGGFVSANKFDCVLTFDDLKSLARFHYVLFTDDEIIVSEGSYTLQGDEYGNWDGDNEKAKELVLNGLSLIRI